MTLARWVGATAALSVALGCGSAAPPRLLVTNGGETPIVALTALFPEDRIALGDVAPGTSTPYRDVPNGVYGYAAYRLELDGAVVTQPVTDWVGEEPLDGEAFTYTLEVKPLRSAFEIVRLVSVSRDR